jgi:hypothetical protein
MFLFPALSAIACDVSVIYLRLCGTSVSSDHRGVIIMGGARSDLADHDRITSSTAP